MKKICINCGNLHSGGGIQVATSFIFELLNTVASKDLNIYLNLSNEVFENLNDLGCDLGQFTDVSILNTYGLSALKKEPRKYFSKFDIIFTIFGPDYLLFTGDTIKIVGFAQPWIIYPKNEVYKRFHLLPRILKKVSFQIQKLFFSRSHHFIVEIDEVKDKLEKIPLFYSKPITVVHNSLASIYRDETLWRALTIEKNKFSIGFLGRDYIHKNTAILPKIKDELFKTFNKDVSFYVTFTEEEWNAKSKEFKLKVNNIGSLTISQCPSFYKKMDAIIFPSLLECFSATPLETMAMKKPLFASDREFIRNICNKYAHYINPQDAVSSAAIINNYIDNSYCNDSENLEEARNFALDFSSPEKRAEQYLNIIRQY